MRASDDEDEDEDEARTELDDDDDDEDLIVYTAQEAAGAFATIYALRPAVRLEITESY